MVSQIGRPVWISACDHALTSPRPSVADGPMLRNVVGVIPSSLRKSTPQDANWLAIELMYAWAHGLDQLMAQLVIHELVLVSGCTALSRAWQAVPWVGALRSQTLGLSPPM